jgi:hypothetical protein
MRDLAAVDIGDATGLPATSDSSVNTVNTGAWACGSRCLAAPAESMPAPLPPMTTTFAGNVIPPWLVPHAPCAYPHAPCAAPGEVSPGPGTQPTCTGLQFPCGGRE